MLKQISEPILRFFKKKKFIFPYSSEKEKKRKEIWDNLQKGILFEDSGVFIRWRTPFRQLNKLCEQRKDGNDRNIWDLGEHTILDGYKSSIEVMKWLFISRSKSFKKISENIGFNERGLEKFNFLKEYITDLLGEPTKIELEKFGSSDIGVVIWENRRVSISIIGIEHFNLRYSFHVGLKKGNKYL